MSASNGTLLERMRRLRADTFYGRLVHEALAEIERLRNDRHDAERYRWLRKNPQWLGWDADFRPDEVEREIDAAMREKEPK